MINDTYHKCRNQLVTGTRWLTGLLEQPSWIRAAPACTIFSSNYYLCHLWDT